MGGDGPPELCIIVAEQVESSQQTISQPVGNRKHKMLTFTVIEVHKALCNMLICLYHPGYPALSPFSYFP